jgi:hypothetical protein
MKECSNLHVIIVLVVVAAAAAARAKYILSISGGRIII